MNPKWLKVTINPTKIADYIQEYNGNKFIKLNINLKRKERVYGVDVLPCRVLSGYLQAKNTSDIWCAGGIFFPKKTK